MRSGFVDLQVNGFGGVDFNADPLPLERIVHACDALKHDGVDAILATVITDKPGAMARRIRRLADACVRAPDETAVIAGLHIEGPFISPTEGFRGAHPVAGVRPASVAVAERLVEAGQGRVRLVTLAPECDPGLRVTRWLVEHGIHVAAGHTDASFELLRDACDAGLSLMTHVGNGCPTQLHRHDNIIQRALALHDRLWCCFIADGAHIPFFALRNYLGVAGTARAIIVSDAMAAAGMGPGRYRLGHLDVEVGEDRVARHPGRDTLAGAAVSMRMAAANCRAHLGLAPASIRRLCRHNPLRAVGLT